MPWLLYAGLAVLGVASAIAAAIVMVRRRRALQELVRGLAALADGRSALSVQARPVGVLGELARAFNELVPRLEHRIDDLEGDRRLLTAVLAGIAEGVIAVDGRRRLLFANEAADQLLGLGSGAVGRLVAELIRVPQIQEAVEATLSGSGAHRVEITIPAREGWPRGQERTVAIHGTPLPGPPADAVIVFRDVTETRRLERVRQDFVANASHELKTPLTAIKASAETLLDGALHDDTVNIRFLQVIDAQADRLNALIHDLIRLARLEAGQDAFRHTPLVLEPAVRRIVEGHRPRARTRSLDYGLDVDLHGEEPVVLADEEAVRQILDNLIDNAINYTPEGGQVRVTLGADADGIILAVKDNGIGIPRDEKSRIFERFYRVDKARSREVGGTGLGLSIVRHVVQSLGAQISVQSRPGSGSTFTVRLPRKH
jgi:two-component system phosphate regulon sensor histidine kinase PhoR